MGWSVVGSQIYMYSGPRSTLNSSLHGTHTCLGWYDFSGMHAASSTDIQHLMNANHLVLVASGRPNRHCCITAICMFVYLYYMHRMLLYTYQPCTHSNEGRHRWSWAPRFLSAHCPLPPLVMCAWICALWPHRNVSEMPRLFVAVREFICVKRKRNAPAIEHVNPSSFYVCIVSIWLVTIPKHTEYPNTQRFGFVCEREQFPIA